MTGKTEFIHKPAEREIIIKRVFDVPRELVYTTYTDPNLIPEWWGPRNLTTTIEKMKLVPGGVWRFVQRDACGNKYAFTGVYREVLPSERLTFTFEYEAMPGHGLLETVTFEAQEGKTKLTDISVFQSVDDRDGMLAMGMETGAIESMDRLAELLVKDGK